MKDKTHCRQLSSISAQFVLFSYLSDRTHLRIIMTNHDFLQTDLICMGSLYAVPEQFSTTIFLLNLCSFTDVYAYEKNITVRCNMPGSSHNIP